MLIGATAASGHIVTAVFLILAMIVAYISVKVCQSSIRSSLESLAENEFETMKRVRVIDV